MSKHSIAVIKGDGIGVDVVDEALKVLHALAGRHGIEWNFVEFPWSSEYYFRTWGDDAVGWCGAVEEFRRDISWVR